ncbi:MAG: hypothetical protein GC201_08030 [Alphaproteobacteria bacterium]|nr:hypothetical protein [Alphaproteobacteria bacterium]
MPAIAAFLALAVAGQADASSPWLALKNYSDSGTLKGQKKDEAQTQSATSYDYEISVYKLDDGGYADGDWYRVDYSLTSAIRNYRKGDNVCGWATDVVDAAFDLQTKGGQIEEYAPTTTESESTRGFTLGGQISKSGPAVKADWSISQVIPDAGIKAKRNTTAENVAWITKLRGCDCKNNRYMPPKDCIGQASNVAKTTFTLNPSVLVRVPEGSGLTFNTYTKDYSTKVGATKYYDGKNEKVRKDYGKLSVTCTSTSCTFR